MEAVDIFLQLADRLRPLKTSSRPQDAKALEHWVRQEGLESLKPQLAKFLQVKALEPEPTATEKKAVKVEAVLPQVIKQLQVLKNNIATTDTMLSQIIAKQDYGFYKRVLMNPYGEITELADTIKRRNETFGVVIKDLLDAYSKGCGPLQCLLEKSKQNAGTV